jgi:ribosomal-protein-alanine N-acetyltransferase
VRLDPLRLGRLEQAAEREGIRPSEFARRAIDERVERVLGEPSALDYLGDYVGAVPGAIAEILDESAPPNDEFTAALLDDFADSLAAGYSMWVLEAGGEVMGYYTLMAAAGEAHLLNLTVASVWRRHGLGRALLGHCLARACEHQSNSLFLEVRTSNTTAISLYHSSGFIDLAVRRAYYPAGDGREDALIMKKDLTC